jgi:hypothetical protein
MSKGLAQLTLASNDGRQFSSGRRLLRKLTECMQVIRQRLLRSCAAS